RSHAGPGARPRDITPKPRLHPPRTRRSPRRAARARARRRRRRWGATMKRTMLYAASVETTTPPTSAPLLAVMPAWPGSTMSAWACRRRTT
ncbi:hypothetical protein LTS01_026015, partial [Friedmanniomyces endolithicus]